MDGLKKFGSVVLYLLESLVNKIKSLDNKKKLYLGAGVLVVILALIVLCRGCGAGEKYRLVKIDTFNGNLDLQRAGNSEEVFEGMRLIPEDRVTTNEGAEAVLLVDNDKHIAANENTSFRINAVGNDKKGQVTINLLYGEALFTIDNKLKEESEFLVNTPNVDLAVRGTTFRVNYNEQFKITEVEVIEGTVWLSADDNELVLEQGDLVTVWGTDIMKYDNQDRPSNHTIDIAHILENEEEGYDYEETDEEAENESANSDWRSEYESILDNPIKWIKANADIDYETSDLRYQYSLINLDEEPVPELIVYVYGDFGGNGRYFPFYIIKYDNGCKLLCTEWMEVNSNIANVDGRPAISNISNGTGDWDIYEMNISDQSYSRGSKIASGGAKKISSMWPDEAIVAKYTNTDDRACFDEY